MKKRSKSELFLEAMPLAAAEEQWATPADQDETFGSRTGDVALAARRRMKTLIVRITRRCWGFALVPQAGREIWQRVYNGIRPSWGADVVTEREMEGLRTLVLVAEGWWDTRGAQPVWLPLNAAERLYSAP